MNMRKRYPDTGFTLIEVMITLAIVAIIASIAVPSYMEYMRRNNRVEAAAALLEAASRMQQRYTLDNTYSSSASSTSSIFRTLSKYKIELVPDSATATGFQLRAVPISGYKDTKCGTFTIDQTGLRGLSGSHTGKVEDCWAGK